MDASIESISFVRVLIIDRVNCVFYFSGNSRHISIHIVVSLVVEDEKEIQTGDLHQ